MELSWNPNTKCTEKLVTTLALVLQYYPQWYILSYFFKLLRIFSLFRMLVEFCLTLMFHHAWEKFFNFMVFTFLENALNLWIFTHAPVPPSKLQVEFFEILFPPRRKGWRKLWFALLNYNQKISRWPGTLIYLFM